MVAALVFIGLITIPVIAAGCIFAAALSPGPNCPACGGRTLLIQMLGLRSLTGLQRRWCTRCGWEGLLRGSKPRPASRAPTRAHPEPHR
jgi:hypothetical protein